MNRKNVIFPIVILLFAVILSVNCYAKTATFEQNEARQLFFDAYVFCLKTHWSPQVLASESLTLSEYDPATKIKDAYAYERANESLVYGGSIEAMKKIADQIFASEIIDRYTEYSFHSQNNDRPLYVKPSADVLFWNMLDVRNGTPPIKFEMAPYETTVDDIVITSMEQSSNKATASIAVNIGIYEPDWRLMTVDYSYTESGWRISGGQFVDIICVHLKDSTKPDSLPIYIPQSPSTGDETPIYIAVCAVSALTVIACGTSVARKRRREN